MATNKHFIADANYVKDYKKIGNMAKTGVVQWGTASNPDLTDWTDTSEAGNTNTVIAELDGHKNVLEQDDQSDAGNCDTYLSFSAQTTGTVEGWFRTTDNTKNSYIRFGNATSSSYISIFISTGNFNYTDGSPHVIVACANDTWYHYKLTFDTTGTWSIIINGTSYGPYAYDGSPANFTKLTLITSTANSAWQTYHDGLGFSWDGYKSSSGYQTQLFEGFKQLPTTKGGFVSTKYISGIAYDLNQTVELAASNATPHAWIKSIIDTSKS